MKTYVGQFNKQIRGLSLEGSGNSVLIQNGSFKGFENYKIKHYYKLKKNVVLEGVIELLLCALNFDLKNLALGP